MKATGIVRRIDELGRVVIPKEIRRTLRIREGDPLEIFTDREGEVILKKYSPIGELGEFAGQYAEALAKTVGIPACISDKDTVIAVSGVSKKELMNKKISEDIEKIMTQKDTYVRKSGGTAVTVSDSNVYSRTQAVGLAYAVTYCYMFYSVMLVYLCRKRIR